MVPVKRSFLPSSLLVASCLLCACAPPDAAAPLGAVARSPAAEEPAARLLDPIVSPELPLDAPVSTQNPRVTLAPGLAFGAGLNLAVWTDVRDDRGVHAARVAADGGVLDPVGIRVAPGYNPAVASDGTSFLVVAFDQDDAHLLGARVTADGEVLDPDGFDISLEAGMAAAMAPAIAFDGAGYLIARPTTDRIELTRVGPDGAPLATGELVVPDMNSYAELGLDCGGGTCLLAWSDPGQAGIRAARIDAQGATLDPGGFAVGPSGASPPAGPGVAYDGVDFVVTWVPHEVALPDRLLAARVTPAGAVLDPAGIEVDTSAQGSFSAPRAAFDGSATVLLWSESLNATDVALRSARLAPDGALASAPAQVATARVQSAALAPRAGGAQVIWTQENTFTWTESLLGVRLDAAGAVIDAAPRPVAIHANDQVSPTAAFDGQHHIVAYTDHRAVEPGIHAARLTPAGELAEPDGIAIGAAGTLPKAIFDGANTLIVWWPPYCEDDSTCTARPAAVRLSPEGVALDPVPLSLPDEAFPEELAVATDGQGTFVLTYTGAAMVLTRVGQDGSMSAAPLNIPGDIIGLGGFGLAHGGETLLAVWPSATTGSILATRVTPAGEVLDQPRSISTLGSDMGTSRMAPAVVFDGRSYVVLWVQVDPEVSGGTPISVKMVRLSPEAEVLGSGEVTLGSYLVPVDSYLEPAPAIVFDGRASIATWRRPADPGAPLFATDVHGAVIDTEGSVLYEIGITSDPRFEGPPALAAAAGGGALVAYSRYVPEAPFGAQRVQARLITVADDGTGGAGGSGGGTPGIDYVEEQDTGCGCEAAGASAGGSGGLALLCALLMARGRRRRADASAREA